MRWMCKSSFEAQLAQYGRLVYTNVGNSMEPLIRQGRDLLIMEQPCGRLKKYDVPLYRRDSGQYVLHRILRVRKEDYVTCGDNRCSREYGVTDAQIIGVLTAIVRNGREISMRNKWYRFYVHLWCDAFLVRAMVLRTIGFIRSIARIFREMKQKGKADM